jgi:hypothetical protein
MVHLRHALAVSLLATSLASAAPTTRPSDEDRKRIDSLISELAADHFTQRERARAELEKMGEVALPALKEATTSDDPSIQSYAQAIVDKFERSKETDREPQLLEGEIVLGDLARFNGRIAWDHRFNFANVRAGAIALGNAGGARTVSVKDGDRQVLLHRDADGRLSIEVFQDDRKQQQFNAENEEDLKKNHPEGFKLFDQHRKLFDRQPLAQVRVGAKLQDVRNNKSTFRMIDGKRVVEIERHGGDEGKVKITLRELATNKITETYEANSPDELRKAHPEIGKLYDRFAPLMERQVPVLGNIPHLNRLFINPKAQIRLHTPEQDADVRERLESALKEAGVSDDQRTKILDRLDAARLESPDQEQITIEADPAGVR